MIKGRKVFFMGEKLVKISLFFFLCFILSISFNTSVFSVSDDFVVETQYIDGEQNIRVPRDMIRSLKKQTALHLIYEKERERLGKLSKPNNQPIRSFQDYRSVILPSDTAKKNLYSNIRNLDLSGSTGNIILYGTSGDKFSVNSVGSLNITLEHSSVLKLKNESVTLKAGDIINVVGKNNVIEVPNVFNINGSLLFDNDSQLTIKLTTDDAHIVVADGIILDLESNTEFKISGDGLVTFGDGSTINLKGTVASPTLYPSFIIDSFTTFVPAAGATPIIKGVGKVIVQDGGTIDIRGYGQNRYLKVAINSTDDIDFYVKGKGMIRIEGGNDPYRTSGYSYAPPSGYYGNLSFGIGKFSLTLKLGGVVYIGNGGWLEFGSVLSEPTSSGHLKKLDFGPDGNFYLNTGGILSFSDNDFVGSKQLTSVWISDDAKILGDGGGLVEYIARVPNPGFNYQGFVGTFQSGNFSFKNISGLIPKDIVKKLVNQSTVLVTAILYTDNAGTNKIRLKNGARIELVNGDIVTGEDSSGNVLARSSSGKTVIYKLDGTRV